MVGSYPMRPETAKPDEIMIAYGVSVPKSQGGESLAVARCDQRISPSGL